MEKSEYSDFIVADNETTDEVVKEVATPNKEVETKTEVTAEPTEKVDKTETQRVSQRINEARQNAKDEVIAEMGYEWNGKPITTEKQYKEALAEQKNQKRVTDLEAKGIDVKAMDEAIENNKSIQEAKELIAQDKATKAQQKNYNDFLAEFPTVKPEAITQETWDLVNKGSSLVDAYTRQESKEMRAKLKVYEQNETNKAKAPISKGISDHGSDEVASEDDFMRGFNSIK